MQDRRLNETSAGEASESSARLYEERGIANSDVTCE